MTRSRKPRAIAGLDARSLLVATRFWSRVQKTDTCWLWAGHTSADGYGQFRVNGRLVYAHRFAWISTHGPIPDEFIVCHRCDNPTCVRPDHFFLGTYTDNVQDRNAKGRQHDAEPRRVRSLLEREHRRLNEAERRQIRALAESGNYSERFLAQLYGVPHTTIHYVIHPKKDRQLDAVAV